MRKLWAWIRSVADAKLLRFLLVGVINTLVGYGIEFGMFRWVCGNMYVASATNYVLTSILSFFLNKYFTFRSKGGGWREVLRFALNIAVCYVISHVLAIEGMEWLLRNADFALKPYLIMVVGSGLFVVTNYLGQRFFAFKE